MLRGDIPGSPDSVICNKIICWYKELVKMFRHGLLKATDPFAACKASFQKEVMENRASEITTLCSIDHRKKILSIFPIQRIPE